MKNILIVDTKSSEAMTLIYRLHDHSTITTSSGETAWRVCNRWKPDLIVVGDMNDMTRTMFAMMYMENASARPLMVAIVREYEPKVYRACRATAIECGYDIVVQSPVRLPTMLRWAEVAELRAITREFFPRTIT